MCGRFAQFSELDVLIERFGFDPGLVIIEPRYNIAPGQLAPVVVHDGRRCLQMMKWGLVPYWAKDAGVGYKMINARAETVAQKPSFKKSFAERRCLVVADGFYEWTSSVGGGEKIPMHIALKSREPFAFAGLWDAWRSPEGEMLSTFTIITTTPNELIQQIHNRMPVILRKEDEGKWLDPGEKNPVKLQLLLMPYEADEMEMFRVSRAVNSAKNDSPLCIKEEP